MKLRNNRPRSKKFLAISILSLASLSYFIYFFSPNHQIQVMSYQLSVIVLIFPLLFLLLFSLTVFLTKSTKHGLLLGLFVIIYLLLRLTNLTHPFFFLLLAGFFLMLELLFSYKK